MMRTFAYVAFAIAALAALTALASGLGHRFGLWTYGFGFTLLGVAAWAGAAGALLSLAAGAWALRSAARRALVLSIAGIAAGTLTFGVPWIQLRQARNVPPIHDITTDTRQPAEFVALLQTRRAAPNGAEYGGVPVAEAQHRGYPDIAPLTYAAPAADAFERCLDAGRALGWEIVAADPKTLRIEATDRTLFFGFRDDIVIRITPLDSASRVDVRSASRVGRSDLGANARRIRAFFRQLESQR
jgi:uncharacterized protein (DUF1499 family)